MLRIVPSTHEEEAACSLEGEFTIYEVAAAKAQLCAALDQASRLQLNLAGLEELDTAGVQLLVWLKQEAHRKGNGWSREFDNGWVAVNLNTNRRRSVNFEPPDGLREVEGGPAPARLKLAPHRGALYVRT